MKTVAAVVLILGLIILAGCGGPIPAPTLLGLVRQLCKDEGVEVPDALIDQIAAVMAGDAASLEAVERTETNQIISPVTGKPCMFVTKDGLTAAGVLAVQLLIPPGETP